MFDWATVAGEVMGVVNVTPDSFSDGGLYLDPEAAIAHGFALREEGAAVLDVGGESTRPGAAPVPAEVEAARVVPVIRALAADSSVHNGVSTGAGGTALIALAPGGTPH